MIQAYKKYGNFVKSYSLFKNRRCIERGDCLNLEYLHTDEHKDQTLNPVRIRSNSTFDFNQTQFVDPAPGNLYPSLGHGMNETETVEEQKRERKPVNRTSKSIH